MSRHAADRGDPVTMSRGDVALQYVEIMLVAGLVGVDCLFYQRFFSASGYLGWTLGALAVGVLGALLAWRLRLSWFTATLVGAALLLGYLVEGPYRRATTYGVPTVATAHAIAGGLLHGWSRMLTVALPADPAPDLYVLPVVLAWAAALAGTLMAVRSSIVLLPLLPPAIAYVAALMMVASRPAYGWTGAAAFLALALLLALVRANRVALAGTSEISPSEVEASEAVGVDLRSRRVRRTFGRVGFGLPVVAMVTLAAATLATVPPLAGHGHPFDPRVWRRQPVLVQQPLSPLADLKNTVNSPSRPLFTVTVQGSASRPDRIRLVALDRYDGQLWYTSGSFERTGHVLPAVADVPVNAPIGETVVRQRISISGLPGPFLPSMGDPTQIYAKNFGFDPGSGALVTPAKQLQKYTYTVVGSVPVAGDRLPTATPAHGPAQDLVVPSPPAWLIEATADATKGTQTTLQQLQAIERKLRTLPYDNAAPPGESYGVLERVLSGSGAEAVSFEEQQATAFALMARSLGIPARVVVGYALDPARWTGASYTVTTKDMRAWPEVDLTGVGWTWFDPTNRHQHPTPPTKTHQTQVSSATGITAKKGTNTGLSQLGLQSDQRHRRPTASALTLIALVAGLLVGLVVLGAVGVLVAKRIRRARRQGKREPSQRILAAWLETLRHLDEQGLRATPSDTEGDVARRAQLLFGADTAEPIGKLAPLVARVIYSPLVTEPDVAAQAWLLEGEARRRLAASVGLRRRARAALSPRGLRPPNRPGRRTKRRSSRRFL